VLKDVRVHGSITDTIDFYATLAGSRLLAAPFYELRETHEGREASFFLAGMYFRLNAEGIAFSGTGGAVSEYMFGSPMPLKDLGQKEVKNRLVFFGTFPAEGGGLRFTAQVSGFQSYENLFLDGNALANTFFLVKVPWPYSVRRTQELLLKTLGRVLKRSDRPAAFDDAGLLSEILKELAEPDATLLLLRLVNRFNQRFYDFVRSYYRREREWGDPQERFVAPLAEELGIPEYQRRRIAVDILYKDDANRPIVDEYKDVLLRLLETGGDPSAAARLNSLRNLATRHGLPRSLFDTLDGLIPADKAARTGEPDYLRKTREIFEGLFLSSRPPQEVVGPREIARLLACKQEAIEHRDNGFEQVLLDTGRVLDERMAETGDTAPFEVFSEVITYFDRLDNASAVVSELAFMEHATVTESKVRSVLGNRRELESVEPGLFRRLVVAPVLENPYILRLGRQKVEALEEGLKAVERGEKSLQEVTADLESLVHREAAERFLYERIRSRLRQFYFDLQNPVHVRLLQRDVEGELRKREGWQGPVPEGAFASALEDVRREGDYLSNVLPRILETGDTRLREEFLRQSGLDRFRLEELEREYREAHGLEEPPAPAWSVLPT